MNIFIYLFAGFMLLLGLLLCRLCSRRWNYRMFQMKMVWAPIYREWFYKKIAFILIVFHLLYVSSFNVDVGVYLSTPLMFLMIFSCVQIKVFNLLNENQKFVLVLFLFTLATAFVPNLYSLAFSCGVILIASFFYPSRRMLDKRTEDPESDDFGSASLDYFCH